MQIRVEQATGERLEHAAAAAGVDVSAYLERLLILAQNQNDPAAISQRNQVVSEHLAYLGSSTATSGRNGRPWREFIHEGHKY